MTKEKLAEQYADSIERSEEGLVEQCFLAGYEEATPKWSKIEDKLPEFNKPILIKYIKGKQGEVITQGYYQDEAQEIADRCSELLGEENIKIAESWRNNGYGLTWFDYSNRQIQALGAKTSKNKVIAWTEIF